ncbi:secreted ookinete protein, putative [Plasmodium sp. gorilla clade G2]|uniref:secreted ookinete protein, putative n=1 Tax=Plasmodium sp. gorilla clade G2 TaxID=880535 RepID=UPI000D20615A|nr:secreted ookinete protein, putative [Plasmodium sp. gorilla clade G2]SOV10240.1 secreted ookinete protein, putative [Plasmodium sp. gorilla clade G2]
MKKIYSIFVICFIILKVCLCKNININDEGKKNQRVIKNENEEEKNNKRNNKKVQHNKVNHKKNNSVTKKIDQQKNKKIDQQINKKIDEEKNKNIDQEINKNIDQEKNKNIDQEINKNIDQEKNKNIDQEINKKIHEQINKKIDEQKINDDHHPNQFTEGLENDNLDNKLFDDSELNDIIHKEKFFESLKNDNNVDNFLLVDEEMERLMEEEKQKSRKLEEDEEEEEDDDEEEDNDEKWKNKSENNNSNNSHNNMHTNYDMYDNTDIYNDHNNVDITQEEDLNEKEAFLNFEKKFNQVEDNNDSSDENNKIEDFISDNIHHSTDNVSHENIEVKKELPHKNENIIKGKDDDLTNINFNNNNNVNNQMQYKTYKEKYEKEILNKPESIKYFFEVITEIVIIIKLGLIYRYTNFLIPFKNFIISKTLEYIEMICVTFLSIHKFGREKYPDIYGFFLILVILYILKYVLKNILYRVYYNKYGMSKKYFLKNQSSENMYMENLLKRILYNVEKKKVLSNYENILQDILENTDNLLVNSNIINKENKNIYTDMISNINNIGVFTYISTQALKKINHKSDLIINELTTSGFIDEDTSNKMDKLKNFSSINEYPYIDIKKYKENLINEYDEQFLLNDKIRYSGFQSTENDKSPANNKYNMDSYNIDSYNMDSYNMDNSNVDNNININNQMDENINMNNNYLSDKYMDDSPYDENNMPEHLQHPNKEDYVSTKNTLKDRKLHSFYNNMDINKKDDNYINKMMMDSDLQNYNGRKNMYLNPSFKEDLKNNDYANNTSDIVEGKEIQQVDKYKTSDMNEEKKLEPIYNHNNKTILNNLNPFSPINDYNNKKNSLNEEQNNTNDSDVITNIANSYINKPSTNINRYTHPSIYNANNKVSNPLLNIQGNVSKNLGQRKNTETLMNNKMEENYLIDKVTNNDMEEHMENKLDEEKLKMNNVFEGGKEYIKTNEDLNNINKAGSFSYTQSPYQGVENANNKNQKYLTQRKERQQIVATKSPFN